MKPTCFEVRQIKYLNESTPHFYIRFSTSELDGISAVLEDKDVSSLFHLFGLSDFHKGNVEVMAYKLLSLLTIKKTHDYWYDGILWDHAVEFIDFSGLGRLGAQKTNAGYTSEKRKAAAKKTWAKRRRIA